MCVEPPHVGFDTGELGAVDARLLACSDPDHLSAKHVTNGIRLCIFDRDQPQQKISYRFRSERAAHDVGEIRFGHGRSVT